MKMTLLIFFMVAKMTVFGQTETSPHGLGLDRIPLREDSSGFVFRDSFDSSVTFFIARDYGEYRLWKNHVLVLTGNLGGRKFTDYFLQFGEWKEYYANGSLKAVGKYERGSAYGVWKYFYPNGKMKNWFTIAKVETDSTVAYCKTGSFEDFYDNGKLKLRGSYRIEFDTVVVAMTILDPKDDERFIDVMAHSHRSKRKGTWTYYKVNGDVEKTENY